MNGEVRVCLFGLLESSNGQVHSRPRHVEKRAALGDRKWHKVAGFRAAFVPLAVVVIELEPAVRDSESIRERQGTTCNEHEACVDSTGSHSGPLGTQKRAPRTDLLAVAVPQMCATALQARTNDVFSRVGEASF